METLLFYLLVVVVSTALVWKGSVLLESASEQLAIYYRLPDIVTGAVVVAVGSSFPELATVVLSTSLHGEFELGVSAIVGSAIFNILVIPGLSGVAAPQKQLQANRDLVYKEAQFYMLAVAVLLITFAFAAIYHPVADTEGTGAILGEVDRWLAIIPLVMYGLYLFVQWQDTMDYDVEPPTQNIRPGKQWFFMLLSLAFIFAGVEGLVRSALVLGETLGTPNYLWGVTVVAMGTSIPDAFVSIRAARHGNATTSLANVFGSNIFDLLICIPVGVLIAGTAVVNFSVATPMMAVLTVATLVLFLFMRTNMSLSKTESWLLLVLYGVFLVWISLESVAVFDTIPSLPPPDPA